MHVFLSVTAHLDTAELLIKHAVLKFRRSVVAARTNFYVAACGWKVTSKSGVASAIYSFYDSTFTIFFSHEKLNFYMKYFLLS